MIKISGARDSEAPETERLCPEKEWLCRIFLDRCRLRRNRSRPGQETQMGQLGSQEQWDVTPIAEDQTNPCVSDRSCCCFRLKSRLPLGHQWSQLHCRLQRQKGPQAFRCQIHRTRLALISFGLSELQGWSLLRGTMSAVVAVVATVVIVALVRHALRCSSGSVGMCRVLPAMH